MALQKIRGNILDYNQLEKGSFLHIDQLFAEMLANPDLGNQDYFTADGNGYYLREDEGIDWTITRESENLVLRHIDDAVNSSFDQIILHKDFYPENAEAKEAKRAENTVVADMGKLRLSGADEYFSFLTIRTKDGFIKTKKGYQPPNDEEQKVLARLGYTLKTLDMLRRAKIAETAIQVTNPEYVLTKLKENPRINSLWRGSRLHYSPGGPIFSGMEERRLIGRPHYLRGIRKTQPQDS